MAGNNLWPGQGKDFGQMFDKLGLVPEMLFPWWFDKLSAVFEAGSPKWLGSPVCPHHTLATAGIIPLAGAP